MLVATMASGVTWRLYLGGEGKEEACGEVGKWMVWISVHPIFTEAWKDVPQYFPKLLGGEGAQGSIPWPAGPESSSEASQMLLGWATGVVQP